MRVSRPTPRAGQRLLARLQHLLIGSGAVLLIAYAAAQIHAQAGRHQGLQAFAARQVAAPAAAPDTTLWSAQRVAAYEESLAEHRDAPLGALRIGRLDLQVPIFHGTGELALNRGLGHIEGTAPLDGRGGNAGIAGHRDGFFRQLQDIAVGDVIDVDAMAGKLRYRVREILIVDPSDVHVLNPTDDPTLTLVTCYPFYYVGHAPRRFIVKAALEGQPHGDALGGE